MANINLLTIHWGMSYGALMQTYATCQLLKEAGHDVRVINLMHPKVRYKYIVPKRWIYLIREFLFWKFKRKNFAPLTSKTFSIKTSKLPNADLTIVGSDQVWNRRITGIFGKTFYLDFVPEHQKRIALSSSFGVSDWDYDETYTREVQLLFDKFDAISVREFSGITILHNVFNKNAVNLLDPTLAYGIFNDLILDDNLKNQIFTFLIKRSVESHKIICAVSRELGIQEYNPSIFQKIFKTGPCHWLTNIRNSKWVITDSFHGTAFCILFHKDFLVLCADEKKFVRIQSLLNLVGLEDRYVKSVDDFLLRKEHLKGTIDYKKIDVILKRERKKYRHFIKENIF